MSPKFLTVVLTLTLGLLHAGAGLAGDLPPRHAAKRPVLAAQEEDVFGRNIFQALVGEFALQRGDVKLGQEAWSDLAVRTRDPQVLARATEVATFARQYDTALELSKLWLEVEPGSEKARQAQSSLFVATNRLDELAPQLAGLLRQDTADLPGNLLQLNRLLARHGDKRAVQKLIDQLASPYDTLPEAHFAMSQAAANAGDNARALNEVEKSLQLRPDWEAAALVRAQLQMRPTPAVAIDGLENFVRRNPTAGDARLALARLQISEKRYNEARANFDVLLKEHPDSPDVIYPAAMLALQQGDIAGGRMQLEKLLKTDFPDKGAIHYFLGQIDEEQARPDAALEHYRLVTGGEQLVPAYAKSAQILAQQGKLDEARMLLQTASATSADKSRFLMAEAQLLRDAGRQQEALGLLEGALAKQPDDPELLYEAALLADQQGKHELLERHLKHLLVLKPGHAQALNALGYSWADRNVRLAEAESLIAKAVQLAPEDPYIMDSLGWVFFRQGKLKESLQTLERAYGIRADPEIAAHLGEVLWTLERKDDARRLLREAARKDPDNEVLAGVIKKLLP